MLRTTLKCLQGGLAPGGSNKQVMISNLSINSIISVITIKFNTT